MSRSETAFERVARQLDLIREDLTSQEARVIEDARDLLFSVGDLFYRNTDADERHCPGSFHVCLIDDDDRDVFVVSRDPLTKEQRIELVRRCTSPLDWSLCSGIKGKATSESSEMGSPVYDGHGRFVGTFLDLGLDPDLSSESAAEGGGV